MSYLETLKTEMREAQITEALLRMKALKLHENAVKEFKEDRKLNLSENGILFWLSDEEQKMVREWEERTGNLVYHVIKNQLEFGLCYSMLYISQYPEEWEMDNEILNDGIQYAYVKNMDFDDCSEYGSIGIKPLWGGLLRTA